MTTVLYELKFIKELLKKSYLVKMNLEKLKQVLSWFNRSKLYEPDGILYLKNTLQIKEIPITKDRKRASCHNAKRTIYSIKHLHHGKLSRG